MYASRAIEEWLDCGQDPSGAFPVTTKPTTAY